MAEKKWLTEKEVAEMTGRSVQSLRNDRSMKRGIPYFKLGKSVRYAINDVVSWMNSRRISTSDDPIQKSIPKKQNETL
jgi:hypothetical protein